MAFNRPRNSREDKSGRSSDRENRSNERPKRSSSYKGNSTPGSDQTSSRPSKKFNSEKPDDKKSFSPRSKPYSGRPTADGDSKPRKTYGGGAASGEKKPFTRSKPYTGRPAADGEERPRKSFDGKPSGDKKPYSSRVKPSSGSFNTGEGFKRKSAGGEKTFEKRASGKSFGDSDSKRSFRDKPSFSERPKRTKPEYDNAETPVRNLRGRKKAAEKETEDTGLIRLNRYISNAGICSRRKADELIAAGVVSVNGAVVSELGYKIDPSKDVIRYNGETLKREKMVYVLLNKPKDYITTTDDPQERRTVMHLVEKASRERIYPIGRLDRNTTGLLLMTNDGELADKLSHPRNNIVKLYHVELNKSLTQGDINKIGFGLELEDGPVKPDSVSYVAGASKKEVGIQIHSGKNRIVRRIFEHLGYEVVKLDRAVYANLTKKDLPRGRWRYLTESEVIQLKHLV